MQEKENKVMEIPQQLKSRKFILAVVTALLVIANEGLNLNIPEDAIMKVVQIVLVYIGVEGTADVVSRAKK